MTNVTVDLGKVKFHWRGNYDIATPYKVDDVVAHDSSSWVCVAQSLGTPPSSTSTFWDLMAEGVDLSTTVTTQGDLLTRGATDLERVGIGTNGQYLGVNTAGNGVEWQTVDTGLTLKAINTDSYTGGVWNATSSYQWVPGCYWDYTPTYATSSSDKIVIHFNFAKGAINGYGMMHGRYYEQASAGGSYTELTKASWQASDYHDTRANFTWVHSGYSDGARRFGWQMREYNSNHQAKIHSTYHFDGTSGNTFMKPIIIVWEYVA